MTRDRDDAGADGATGRRGVLGRRLAIALTAVAVTILFIAIPMHSYLQQRADLDASREVLRSVEADNERLDARRKHLSDPGEITRIARRDYGLVEVGEESYSVLPPSTAGLVLPQAWPFDRIEQSVRTASGG